MPFTTLEQRFNAKSSEIYNALSPRQTPEGQPYVSILPDSKASNTKIKDDTQSLPIISTRRDLDRISKFLQSADGRFFINRQTLLQTGNTFANTKLYNPKSPLLSTVPFVHPRRHIVQSLLRADVPGLLQNSTINTLSSKFQISGQLQEFSTGRQGVLPTIGSIAKTYLATQLKNVANAILPIPQNYTTSRPEYKIFDKTGPMIFEPQPLNQRGIPRLNVTANIKGVVTSKIRSTAITGLQALLPKKLGKTFTPYIPPKSDKIPAFAAAALTFKQNFNKGRTDAFRFKSKYLNERPSPSVDYDDYQQNTATSDYTKLNDQYNIVPQVSTTDVNKLNYDNITKDQGSKSDIIKFIFKDAEGNNPVHFRALLSSIKESIKTEFNEQRYVGRTERFVTYGGAKRGVGLTFNIVAFSEGEFDGMWSRINYLSGLAFPKNATNGFMTPPLFQMSIGGIYQNQPCYIESLDYDFLDESITFDLDTEVPFAINVTMQLSLLEKRSRFYDSPFYKITEDIAKEQKKLQTTSIS